MHARYVSIVAFATSLMATVMPAAPPKLNSAHAQLVNQLVADTEACGTADGFSKAQALLRFGPKTEEWRTVKVSCKESECEPSFEEERAALINADEAAGLPNMFLGDNASFKPPKGQCNGIAAAERYSLSERTTEELEAFLKTMDHLRQGQYYEELFAGLTCTTRLGPGDLSADAAPSQERLAAAAEIAAKAQQGRPEGDDDQKIIRAMVMVIGDARLTPGDVGSSAAIKELMLSSFRADGDAAATQASEKELKDLINAARIIDPGFAGILLSRRFSQETESTFVEILNGLRTEAMARVAVRKEAARLGVVETRIPDLEKTALYKAQNLYDKRREQCIVCATKSIPAFVEIGLSDAIPQR